jgi:hypothetical protein
MLFSIFLMIVLLLDGKVRRTRRSKREWVWNDGVGCFDKRMKVGFEP